MKYKLYRVWVQVPDIGPLNDEDDEDDVRYREAVEHNLAVRNHLVATPGYMEHEFVDSGET